MEVEHRAVGEPMFHEDGKNQKRDGKDKPRNDKGGCASSGGSGYATASCSSCFLTKVGEGSKASKGDEWTRAGGEEERGASGLGDRTSINEERDKVGRGFQKICYPSPPETEHEGGPHHLHGDKANKNLQHEKSGVRIKEKNLEFNTTRAHKQQFHQTINERGV